MTPVRCELWIRSKSQPFTHLGSWTHCQHCCPNMACSWNSCKFLAQRGFDFATLESDFQRPEDWMQNEQSIVQPGAVGIRPFREVFFATNNLGKSAAVLYCGLPAKLLLFGKANSIQNRPSVEGHLASSSKRQRIMKSLNEYRSSWSKCLNYLSSSLCFLLGGSWPFHNLHIGVPGNCAKNSQRMGSAATRAQSTSRASLSRCKTGRYPPWN